MRFISLTLRCYRVHRDVTVRFAPNLTLIGGPNEAGKSTLIEAIHRALFLRAKGNTEYHRAMVSTLHGGRPEVVLEFEAAGKRCEVRKTFGTNGTVHLVREGTAAINGEEAETALAQLLGVDGQVKGKDLPLQWAHVWVWQGSSGLDPAEHANRERQHLNQRLQDAEGGALLTSALDDDVARFVTQQLGTYFGQRGDPLKNGPLGRAIDAVEKCHAERCTAELRLQRLTEAITAVEESTATLGSIENAETALKAEEKDVADKIEELSRLRTREADEQRVSQNAEKTFTELESANATIVELTARLSREHEAIGPLQRGNESLEGNLKLAQSETQQLEHKHAASLEGLRRMRGLHDLQSAHLELLRASARLEVLVAREKEIAERRTGLARLKEEFGRLPPVDGAGLKKLNRLSTDVIQAEAALNAIATGLEVRAAEAPVTVGDRKLAAGESITLTTDTDVQVGDSVCLRVRPGGGTSLDQARRAEMDAREKLRNALAELAVADLQAANDALARRNQIGPKIEELEAELGTQKVRMLGQQLEDARGEITARKAEVARRAEQYASPTLGDAEKDCRAALGEAAAALQRAEDEEVAAGRAVSSARRKLEQMLAAIESSRAAVASARQKAVETEAQLKLLHQTHGDDHARAGKLVRAKSDRDQCRARVAETGQTIAALQPDVLERARVRISSARERNRTASLDATQRRAEALGALRSDGTEDPAAGLKEAEARCKRAKEQLQTVQRDAEALKLLKDEFDAARQELADRFTRPLVERISGYLACIFGPGAKAVITHNDDGIEGLSLARGLDTVPFAALSGGTREQVAAAVRLALAEILAADFDGCLPVLFDDAFAYADPQRVTALQDMLYLAATRGLQVIVLSCNPADYATLGAQAITLAPALMPRAGANPVVGSRIVEGDGEPGTTDSDGSELLSHPALSPEQMEMYSAALIEKLSQLSGTAGNQTLRQQLGWDESTYQVIKAVLLAANRIKPGRGRGGSVMLA